MAPRGPRPSALAWVSYILFKILGTAVWHADVAWKEVVAASLRAMLALAPALALHLLQRGCSIPFDSLRFLFQQLACSLEATLQAGSMSAASARALLPLKPAPRPCWVLGRQVRLFEQPFVI